MKKLKGILGLLAALVFVACANEKAPETGNDSGESQVEQIDNNGQNMADEKDVETIEKMEKAIENVDTLNQQIDDLIKDL
ncbi:MAG: hypothetical protein KDC92_02690 [Bacteroidetes bacterium]|nr:hypothetical protein [Bacteroidota bacterium]